MTPSGLPHSDIPGSKVVRHLPGAYRSLHVLHRLLAPRHPPCALCNLTFSKFQSRRKSHLPLFNFQRAVRTLPCNLSRTRPRSGATRFRMYGGDRTSSFPVGLLPPANLEQRHKAFAPPIHGLIHPDRPHPNGGDRTRTDNPQLAKLVLCQLSYAPIKLSGRPSRATANLEQRHKPLAPPIHGLAQGRASGR